MQRKEKTRNRQYNRDKLSNRSTTRSYLTYNCQSQANKNNIVSRGQMRFLALSRLARCWAGVDSPILKAVKGSIPVQDHGNEPEKLTIPIESLKLVLIFTNLEAYHSSIPSLCIRIVHSIVCHSTCSCQIEEAPKGIKYQSLLQNRIWVSGSMAAVPEKSLLTPNFH